MVTKFGQVMVRRIAYRAPGVPNVHLLDTALNLPEEKHSHGLRKMAVTGAARGSHEGAAAVTRATGVSIGKRQLEDLARRAAVVFAALLRWFRFLWAAEMPWDQATRAEARDFMRHLQPVLGPGGRLSGRGCVPGLTGRVRQCWVISR